ncbi:leucine-rich repeat serine/threonine-protein kinase 2-like [Antedon mediterranea]|uniref:leucine-rich repeat serine/threonine-protein kinase 2-like n=1 Tax=Antedon mediterranea TaxID=105859 RepID=UPI003AF70CDA
MDNIEDEEKKNRTFDLLLLLKNDFEINKLPKICEELIELAQFESCQNVIMKYDGDQTVLDTMANQPKDRQTQRTCCGVLYCWMDSNVLLREKIQESSAYGQIIQALENFPEYSDIQAVGLRTIGLLASSKIVCDNLMNEEWILCATLEAMTNYSMDTDVQSACCMALHYLLSHDIEEQKEFFAKEKYEYVLTAMKNHTENPCVMREAFWALNTMAHPDETYDVLLAKSHKHLFRAMARFPMDVGVQMACCSLIETFARTDESQNFLEVNGASRLTLAAIRNHSSRGSGNLQTLAFTVLDSLGTAIDNNSKVTGSTTEVDWIEEAHKALTTFQNEPDVLDAVCKSLSTLLMHRPECIAKAEDDDLNLSLDSPILACLLIHEKDGNLAASACTALYHVMMCSDLMQSTLMKKGVFIGIKKCMKFHVEDTRVLAGACQALLGVCNKNTHYKDYLIEDQSDIVDYVFKALRQHSGDPLLVVVAIQLITCLAEVDVFRNQCLTEGVHEVILERMVHSQTDANMQSVMMEALAVLSTAEGMVDMLNESDAYDIAVQVMDYHYNNIDIVLKGCILLQALLSKDEERELSQVEKAASVIIQAMEQFSDIDPSEEGFIQGIEKLTVIRKLQEEGCVVLQFLAEISEDVARMLVNLKIHDRLFHIIDKYDDEEGIKLHIF